MMNFFTLEKQLRKRKATKEANRKEWKNYNLM